MPYRAATVRERVVNRNRKTLTWKVKVSCCADSLNVTEPTLEFLRAFVYLRRLFKTKRQDAEA